MGVAWRKVAVAASAVLAAVVAAAWVTSYRVTAFAGRRVDYWPDAQHRCWYWAYVALWPGTLRVADAWAETDMTAWPADAHPVPLEIGRRFATWTLGRQPANRALWRWHPSFDEPISWDMGGDVRHSLDVPLWWLQAATLALPAAALARRVRTARRAAAGACPACGYDLRATPDRCPECGHAPPSAAHA